MEKLNELIGKCVLGNVMFEGALNSSAYTVQEIVHTTALKTLNNMWKKLKRELNSLDVDSLFKNPSITKKNTLQLKVEVLEGVFQYRQELAERVKLLEKNREERAEKLKILKKIKTEKEFGELEGKSLADIDAEIAKLEII